MGRTWTLEDFDPKKDKMMDCSSADSAEEGYADDDALNGVEEESN